VTAAAHEPQAGDEGEGDDGDAAAERTTPLHPVSFYRSSSPESAKLRQH
jgi:hypothetical protein